MLFWFLFSWKTRAWCVGRRMSRWLESRSEAYFYFATTHVDVTNAWRSRNTFYHNLHSLWKPAIRGDRPMFDDDGCGCDDFLVVMVRFFFGWFCLPRQWIWRLEFWGMGFGTRLRQKTSGLKVDVQGRCVKRVLGAFRAVRCFERNTLKRRGVVRTPFFFNRAASFSHPLEVWHASPHGMDPDCVASKVLPAKPGDGPPSRTCGDSESDHWRFASAQRVLADRTGHGIDGHGRHGLRWFLKGWAMSENQL